MRNNGVAPKRMQRLLLFENERLRFVARLALRAVVVDPWERRLLPNALARRCAPETVFVCVVRRLWTVSLAEWPLSVIGGCGRCVSVGEGRPRATIPPPFVLTLKSNSLVFWS
jgi:hypothetical protein